jgi:hypothetical protein
MIRDQFPAYGKSKSSEEVEGGWKNEEHRREKCGLSG